MKLSTILLCLASTIVLAQPERAPQAIARSSSIPNNSPAVPLPDVQSRPDDDSQIPSEAEQTLHIQVADALPKPDAIPNSLLRRTTRSLRARRPSTELTKRSEGTLGQTPWIGMAIGLGCTTLAAVMLG